MPTTDKLDCMIYVESSVSIGDWPSSSQIVSVEPCRGPHSAWTISTPVCDIEVRRNPDRREVSSGGEDEFLFYANCSKYTPMLAVSVKSSSTWSGIF